MISPILTVWYAVLLFASPPVPVSTAPQVTFAEQDGWHFLVRKNDHYFVIQAGSYGRFRPGDRLKTLQEREGEQWVLVNDTPRRTSVLVYGFRLSYDEARTLSASRSLRGLQAAN